MYYQIFHWLEIVIQTIDHKIVTWWVFEIIWVTNENDGNLMNHTTSFCADWRTCRAGRWRNSATQCDVCRVIIQFLFEICIYIQNSKSWLWNVQVYIIYEKLSDTFDYFIDNAGIDQSQVQSDPIMCNNMSKCLRGRIWKSKKADY